MGVFKTSLAAGCALMACLGSARADYIYVGSWLVGEGPDYHANPLVYSGQDAAALLFGGAASDYVTSTIDANPNNINFKTFLDGFGNERYLISPAADDYKLSSNGGGYNAEPAYSAYILDHTCANRYSHPSQSCDGTGTAYRNYAFRAVEDTPESVPEPGTAALLTSAILGLCMLAKRRHP